MLKTNVVQNCQPQISHIYVYIYSFIRTPHHKTLVQQRIFDCGMRCLVFEDADIVLKLQNFCGSIGVPICLSLPITQYASYTRRCFSLVRRWAAPAVHALWPKRVHHASWQSEASLGYVWPQRCQAGIVRRFGHGVHWLSFGWDF